MSNQEKLSDIKLKLNSATKQKITKEGVLISLHNKEICYTEEITHTREENECLRKEINGLTTQISQMKCQIAMIDVCAASERAKIDVHVSNLIQNKNGYDELFKKERDLLDKQNEQIKQKEFLEEELEKEKMLKVLEKNEEEAKEAAFIEDECEAIERECIVLTKRNKAIMLKLRRKLIETEELRRELVKKNENILSDDMQE